MPETCAILTPIAGITVDPATCSITVDTTVTPPGTHLVTVRRTDSNTGAFIEDTVTTIIVPEVAPTTVVHYTLDGVLKCADCIVDLCGVPLPAHESGCLVMPRSSVVDNGDGTATHVYLDGHGNVETTVLLTPDPDADHCNVLRGNGWFPEDNADLRNISGADFFDLTGDLPATNGTLVQVQTGRFSITNNTLCRKIYTGHAFSRATVLVDDGNFNYNFDFGANVNIFVDGVLVSTQPVHFETYGGQSTTDGHFLRSSGQMIASTPADPGQTVEWRLVPFFRRGQAGVYQQWSHDSTAYRIFHVNHTTDEVI